MFFWLVFGAARGGLLGLLVGLAFSVADADHHMFSTKLELAAAVGSVVGMLVGKPVWKDRRWSRGVIKALLGAAACCVVTAVAYFLEPHGSWESRMTSHYLPLSLALGALWGAVVGADERA